MIAFERAFDTGPKKKILVPDGDRRSPHPPGICWEALSLLDKTLHDLVAQGKTPSGSCIRRPPPISGCLILINPPERRKGLGGFITRF